MINVKFKIKEIEGRISLEGSGGSPGFPTKLEYEFAEKFIEHVNSFNTQFKRIRTEHPIRMRVKR